MRKHLKLILLGLAMFICAIILNFPLNFAKANSGDLQWVEVRCQDLNGTVACNDCTSGTKSCYDNSCSACYGSGGGSIK